MNEIATSQNQERNLVLRRAIAQTYRMAKSNLMMQLALTMVVPVGAAIVGLVFPQFRPVAAAIGISALALDIFGVDRRQRKLLKQAALIAECFDCAVLDITANRVAIKQSVSENDVQERAAAYKARVGNDERTADWYPVSSSLIPIHLGRIVCQLTNAQYDGRLRNLYKWIVGLFALSIAVGLACAAAALNVSTSDALLVVAAPMLPIMVWAAKELIRQVETDGPLREIQDAASDLWGDAVEGRADPNECAVRSRALQDMIFHYRSRSPMPIPFVYAALRPHLETKMNVSAEDRLRQAGLL